MADFVTRYSTRTGRKQRIPRAWAEHPLLGKGWRKTPKQRAEEPKTPAGRPSGGNTPPAGD